MPRRAVLLLLPVLLVVPVAACSDDGDASSSSGDRVADIAAQVESGDISLDGEDLYNKSCAMCHGSEGQGGTGMPLAGVVADKYTPSEHVTIVLNGRGGMPSFSSSLEDDVIAAIVEYERTDLGQ